MIYNYDNDDDLYYVIYNEYYDNDYYIYDL